MGNKAKQKITWITPDYFVDCDFNSDILEVILESFEIHWIILLPSNNSRFSEVDFEKLKKLKGLKIEFLYSLYRQRDPRRLIFYRVLLKKIKELDSVITYLNFVPDPYFLPFFWLLNKKKTIFCAHDGDVHSGFDFKFITKLTFNLAYKFVKHVCMFSHSQANLFHSNFPKAKIYIIPLSLKSFGESSILKASNEVIFLSFGVINYSKNIELLIDAACNIFEKGYTSFKVSINGRCSNWAHYQSHIRYPDLFKCSTRLIKTAEIADLFTSAHYFVQPYRHVSQSGAMKVAFNYNLPVIATNFPGFSDEIKEGINGYLFKSSDVIELEKLMMRVLDNHEQEYPLLLNKMANFTKKCYSSVVLAQKYLKMFNEVIYKAGE